MPVVVALTGDVRADARREDRGAERLVPARNVYGLGGDNLCLVAHFGKAEIARMDAKAFLI